TPGYPDFSGLAISALAAVETAAIVINAQTGIEMTTRRAMAWAQARQLCRMIIINGIDGDKVALPALLTEIQEAFGKECLPINLPADNGS
ncbi:GTP-binding protein, partial [Pseudomonas sp. GW460-13]|uniref:GTP-binding protein n=1 Tax=Pseudomonas sp. GW460-13 TaxID=2070590 RepID=UPI000CAC9210